MSKMNSYEWAKFKKKHKNLLRLAVILSAASILLAGAFGTYKGYKAYKLYTEKVDVKRDPAFVNPEPTPIKNGEEETVIPSAKILETPYTVQAPLVNWNIHEESCEEAALLMYRYFLEGQTTFSGKSVIPAQSANTDLIKMKEWQVKNYGKEPDLSIADWGKFAKEYYGYEYQIFENITKEDIQKQIAEGNPVVVPVITHALRNPHYGSQPSYHVLLIKGYKQGGVIANDAGVKEGENYFYTWDILFSAIDAQTQKMKQGRVMAILSK